MNNFPEIEKKSAREWKYLAHPKKPVIYLGMASCGRAAGAEKVKKIIHDFLGKNKIDARVVEVGCIGACYLEPIMDIAAHGNPRISFGWERSVQQESAGVFRG
jgi:hypothetical protein